MSTPQERVLEWIKPADGVLTSKLLNKQIYLLESLRGANMYDMVRARKLVNDMRTVLVYITEQEKVQVPIKLRRWWFY